MGCDYACRNTFNFGIAVEAIQYRNSASRHCRFQAVATINLLGNSLNVQHKQHPGPAERDLCSVFPVIPRIRSHILLSPAADS